MSFKVTITLKSPRGKYPPPGMMNTNSIRLFSSDVGMYDRIVISEILKEIAQTQQVDLSAKQRFKGELHVSLFSQAYPTKSHLFPVVVINEADSLSRDAQAALRRTMERYMSNLRIIMCANSTSKLIAPIKSRCLLVRVAAPNDEEVSSCDANTASIYPF